MEVKVRNFEIEISKLIYNKLRERVIWFNKTVNLIGIFLSGYIVLKYILIERDVTTFYYLVYSSILYIFFERFVKKAVKKQRPFFYFNMLEFSKEYFSISKKNKKLDSFPSSHSLISFLLLFYFTFYKKDLICFLFILIPLFRLLGLKHWVLDIMASLLVALIFYFLFILFL